MDFSIGEAVAALGLVVAVYGLMKPKWRLNFYLNWRFLISVVALVSLGVVAPFVAFSLRPLDLPYLNVIEGLAWVFFVCATIDFIRCAFWRQPLYRKRASTKEKTRFIRCVLDEALFSEPESLNAVLTIVRDSLDEICSDIQPYSNPLEDRAEDLAAYLLDTLLGESKVVNHIAANRLDFIYRLIGSLEKARVGSSVISNGVSSLMVGLYTNPDSYLYQQIGYTGLSNYASIYEAIFGNEYFIATHGPIRSWYDIGQRVNYKDGALNNPKYAEVFIKGFTRSLEKFAYTGSHVNTQAELARGMYQLGEYARTLSYEVRKQRDYDYFAPSSQALNVVMRFVAHGFYYDVFTQKGEAGHLVGDALNPPLDGEKWHEGLSSAFARLFVQMTEVVVTSYGRGEAERMEVLELNEVFVQTISSHPYIEGVRKKILHHLWIKSEDNIVRGHFPVVFRALVIMLYWRGNTLPVWAKQERNKMIDTLRNKVKPRILRGESMSNDEETPKEEELLPKSVAFDRENGKFYAVDRRGNKTELRRVR